MEGKNRTHQMLVFSFHAHECQCETAATVAANRKIEKQNNTN